MKTLFNTVFILLLISMLPLLWKLQPMPFTKLLADKDSETSQLSQLGLLNRATKRRTKEPSRQNQAKASRQSKAQVWN